MIAGSTVGSTRRPMQAKAGRLVQETAFSEEGVVPQPAPNARTRQRLADR